MKYRNSLVLTGLFFLLFIQACLKEDDSPEEGNYFAQFGIVNNTEGNVVYLMDDNHNYISDGDFLLDIEVVDGQRVLIFYSIMDEVTDDPFIDNYIRISSINYISLKEIHKYGSYDPAILGGDPMDIGSIGTTKHYLNLYIAYNGGMTGHSFNMIEREVPDFMNNDTLKLELRHNGNNDPGYRILKTYISYNLDVYDSLIRDSIYIEVSSHGFLYDNYILSTVYYPEK